MEPFDEKQSLQIITQMINTAKNKLQNNSFFFLLWGWAVLLASVTHYVLWKQNYEYHFLPWPVLMTTAAITSAVAGYRMSKASLATSYIDNYIGTMWMYLGISLFLVLLLVTAVANFRGAYVALMIFYGMGTLTTGTIIKFKPLIIGGIFAWVCAAALVWVDFPEGLLVLGASVLGGYIIPGYILRAKRERNPEYGL
ncbi:MAG: hypothetical protein F9K23_02390 [Bacteroidetes bacterium]|nr:MAG: hypothetical protein F9K23_02390 [Bacteroidota bacterium]